MDQCWLSWERLPFEVFFSCLCDGLLGATYANLLVPTQWPLKGAAHLTPLVWVCVVWRPESTMKLSVLWKFHNTETALTSVLINWGISMKSSLPFCYAVLIRSIITPFCLDCSLNLVLWCGSSEIKIIPFSEKEVYLNKCSLLNRWGKFKEHDIDAWNTSRVVLGPILITIYMLPLGNIINWYGLQYHRYAGDWQLYKAYSFTNSTECVGNMEALFCDIKGWFAENMLKMNDEKTEMLIIGSKYRQIFQIPELHIGSSVIKPAAPVKTFGVIKDSSFTMEQHIKKHNEGSFLSDIREIPYYRRFFIPFCSKTLIHAYITLSWTIVMAFCMRLSIWTDFKVLSYCCSIGHHGP